MDSQQQDPQSEQGSAGVDFMKMMILTVVCIIGAVALVKVLELLL